MKEAYDIILKPLLSERTYDNIPKKKYTFIVHPDANKSEIKWAVEKIFNVKVQSVNTLNQSGKLHRQGRTQGYTQAIKKAFVTLKKDSKPIEFFESMAQ
jgi:large subunit ribosomal protein L23